MCGIVSEEYVSIKHYSTRSWRVATQLHFACQEAAPRFSTCALVLLLQTHDLKAQQNTGTIFVPSDQTRKHQCQTACLVVHTEEELFTVARLGSCGTPPLERRMPIRQSIQSYVRGNNSSRQHYARSHGSPGAPRPARSASTGVMG